MRENDGETRGNAHRRAACAASAVPRFMLVMESQLRSTKSSRTRPSWSMKRSASPAERQPCAWMVLMAMAHRSGAHLRERSRWAEMASACAQQRTCTLATPLEASHSRAYSIMGALTSGRSALGVSAVTGRKRCSRGVGRVSVTRAFCPQTHSRTRSGRGIASMCLQPRRHAWEGGRARCARPVDAGASVRAKAGLGAPWRSCRRAGPP